MKIKIETSSYNHRRYSRPWIAKVSLHNDKFQYSFGTFVGQHGYSGMVVIDANEGDVIAQGQKDNRGNNTDNSLYLVQEDGTLKSLSKVAAYDILSQKQENANV